MAAGEIVVYEKAGFGSIRMFEEDGEIYAVADDFAKALGYHEAKDMVRSLEPDEFTRHIVPGNRGAREANVVNEAGMYHAILMRRSACVKDPDARERVERFQRWVTHEVLPSIRRTGAYANPQFAPTPEERIALALRDADEVIAGMHARMEAMRPMAELGEAVSATEDVIDMAAMANLLSNAGFRIGRNGLFKLLREDGILKSGRDWNLPYQEYVDRGYFTVVETSFRKPDGTVHVQLTTYVTGRGQAFLLNRYARVRELAGVRHGE